MTCTFIGSSDVFGIGIRIGYYTQMLAVWFANYFNQGPASSLRAVNNLFLLALICAGFMYFASPAQTKVVEVFLLLMVGLVVGLVGINEAGRSGTKYTHVSQERLIIRVCTITFGAAFNALFWWKALDIMRPTPCNGVAAMGVGTYAWYGWKVSLYGLLRTLMKVQSLFAAAWTAPMLISKDVNVLLIHHRMRVTRTRFIDAIESLTKSRESIAKKFDCPFARRPMGAESEATLPSACQTLSGTLKSGHQPTTTEKANDMGRFLSDVERANQYIDLLFSIYVKPEPSYKKRANSLFKILDLSKRQLGFKCTDNTPYIRCLWRTILMSTDFRSWSARCVLAEHFIRMGRTSGMTWPRIVNHMYGLSKSRLKSGKDSFPDWHTLKIVSDLRLSRVETHKATSTWVLEASMELFFIIVLVVQVEMTIFFNHITGLNSLSNLGQLIPFILGVGGLIKVVWEKVALNFRGGEVVSRNKDDYEVAVAAYDAWRSNQRPGFDGRGLTRAVTA